MRSPRVAYFPDSFHEVNGVAHTSRNFVAYALRKGLPFLCVRAGVGGVLTGVDAAGPVEMLELPRSVASVGVEKDLAFDPLFWRHADAIEDALYRFKPDVLHLTGPSELGIFAAYFAWKLKLPLAASWHTNVHEYAAKRLNWLTSRLPAKSGAWTAQRVESSTLKATAWLYRLAGVLFAPNQEACELLARSTGKPCELMQRGVDTKLFSPAHRTAALPEGAGAEFTLGFVGRLSIEKNVSLLPRVQTALTAAGVRARFLIVGQGDQEGMLRRELPAAEFAGVLRGKELSAAYANMDVFVFPSHTDTFGNVVLEALASGVPAVVTPYGGPHHIVRTGETGVISDDAEFAREIAVLLKDPERLAKMRVAARSYAETCTWDGAFDRVYRAYGRLLESAAAESLDRTERRGSVGG